MRKHFSSFQYDGWKKCDRNGYEKNGFMKVGKDKPVIAYWLVIPRSR